MKLHRALTVAAVIAALVVPFGGSAGAVTTTSLTVVDAYQYSASSLMDHDVCIDGVQVHDGSEVGTQGISSTPGTHNIVVNDSPQGCAVTSDSITGTVDLLDTAAQTLVINWPGWENEAYVLETTVFADDVTCTQPGTARIVYRNVSSYAESVGTLGSATGGVKTPLIADILTGNEGVATVPAGTFPVAPATLAAWNANNDEDFIVNATSLPADPGSVILTYTLGGADGPIGLFGTIVHGSVCDAVTTTTTTTTTTVIPSTTTTIARAATGARAATPVAAQPRYTG